jgi:two-component system, chemotaxis family, protein-glutamate methylesterase/glutaminase
MSMIKALVVDDSRVVRQLVTRALNMDSSVYVVGEAADGKEALEAVQRLRPDVVILDIEMPHMNGLEVVHALHGSDPHLPIIMFSSLTERGAKATVEALLAGASDYVLKPSSMDSLDSAVHSAHDELVPKIKALCSRVGAVARSPKTAPVTAPASKAGGPVSARKTESVPPDVIVICSSTGGPDVLVTVLAELPATFRVPVLIAQHMPPLFTAMFAARLDRTLSATVSEGIDGELVQPGHVYIAPGDHHMDVARTPKGNVLRIHQSPKEENCRPSGTRLLRSSARIYGAKTLAVVLTGMGTDGLLGCQAVQDAGGAVLVQDEQSSTVWGMPGAVVRAGLADHVMAPQELARRLAKEAV